MMHLIGNLIRFLTTGMHGQMQKQQLPAMEKQPQRFNEWVHQTGIVFALIPAR
jgi:hypothetical protein